MSIEAVARVLRDKITKGNDRLVLIALADYANDDGTGVFPSIPKIAAKANCEERTVERCLKSLVDLGEIEEVGKTPKGTRAWRVLTGLNRGGENGTPDKMSGVGDPATPDICDTVPPTSTPATPDISSESLMEEPSTSNRQEEPSGKTAKKTAAKKELAEKAKRIFDFWLSLDASKNPNEYTFTEKRKKAAIKRLGDSTDQEIADALRGQWHDEWCQRTGKLDMEYALRSRENLEDFRDRRKRQVGTTVAATSNGNGQPSAHPEYDTTRVNPIVEAIKLIDANGPRTANEVAQALGRELEPTREMLMQMVEDGDCVYEAARAAAGEGTYARPGEAM